MVLVVALGLSVLQGYPVVGSRWTSRVWVGRGELDGCQRTYLLLMIWEGDRELY